MASETDTESDYELERDEAKLREISGRCKTTEEMEEDEEENEVADRKMADLEEVVEKLRVQHEETARQLQEALETLGRMKEGKKAERKGWSVVEKKGKRGAPSTTPEVTFRAKRVQVAEPRPQSQSSSAGSQPRVTGWRTTMEGYQVPILEEAEPMSQASQPTPAQREPPKKRIPPIVITDEAMYNVARDVLVRNNVEHTAKMGGTGVKVFTEDAAGHQLAVQVLKVANIKFHYFMLPEEKPLKTVLRGIPSGITEDEVKADLELKGVNVQSVVRMRRDKATPLPLMVVTSEKSEEGKRKMFEVSNVAGLVVRVESKRRPTAQTQCYRCQMFGHVQFRCTADEVCGFCADKHPSRTCPRPRGRGQPAICANCGGNHPAFYVSCPKHPSKVKEEKQRRIDASTVRNGMSFAQAASQGATSGAVNDALDERIERVLQRLLPSLLKAIHG